MRPYRDEKGDEPITSHVRERLFGTVGGPIGRYCVVPGRGGRRQSEKGAPKGRERAKTKDWKLAAENGGKRAASRQGRVFDVGAGWPRFAVIDGASGRRIRVAPCWWWWWSASHCRVFFWVRLRKSHSVFVFIRPLRSPTASWKHISLYLRVSFSRAPRIFCGIVVACEAALLDYLELLLKYLFFYCGAHER